MTSICPQCYGKGIVEDDDTMDDTALFDVCPLCDGEGQIDRELQRQRF